MKNGYYSLQGSFRFRPDQLADMCVRFADGEKYDQLARLYMVTPIAIEGHILKYYGGITPKDLQEQATLDSKVNKPLIHEL